MIARAAAASRGAALVIGVVYATGAGAALAQQAQANDRLLVALVRAEGVVVPFAEYVGGTWYNSGADAGRSSSVVPGVWFIRGGGAPRQWSVMLATGGRRNAQTNTATLVQSYCSPQWGLLSDIGQQDVPLSTLRRQVGVAIAGPGTLDGFAELDRSSSEVAHFTAAVLPTFDHDEDAALARWTASGKGPLDPAIERHSIPFTIEAAYRSRITIAGQSLIYLRVSRLHRESAAPSSPCSQVSVLDAWMFDDGRGHPAVGSANRFVLADCARRDVRTGVPFGIVRVDARAFVIFVDYRGDAEDYRILSISGDAVRGVLSTFGGGC